MGYAVANKTDMVLDKDRFKKACHGMKKTDVWLKMTAEFGLEIQYKSFLNLLENRVTWRLIYAHALVSVLGKQIDDLFHIVYVDAEDDMEDPVDPTPNNTTSHHMPSSTI